MLDPHGLFMSVVDSVKRLADAYVASATEIATLKQQLADAMANDAADAAAVQEAQLAATEALAKANSLQQMVDADALEDADIQAIVDTALPPVP
ncbi:MAG: hypothetical protein ACRC62_20375 [Microcoleus sp.]